MIENIETVENIEVDENIEINDNEKLDEVEKQILNGINNIKESKNEDIINEEEFINKKIPKKKQIIMSIRKVADKIGETVPTEKELGRMKINILEKMLAGLAEKLTGKILNAKMAQLQPKQPDNQNSDNKDVKPVTSSSLSVENLYNLNIIASNMVERISILLQDDKYYGPYTPNLEGLTKKLLFDEIKIKQLKDVLASILNDHREILEKFCTPLLTYAALMISTGSEVAFENKKNSTTDIIKNK
jgi:hypothetical protein